MGKTKVIGRDINWQPTQRTVGVRLYDMQTMQQQRNENHGAIGKTVECA